MDLLSEFERSIEAVLRDHCDSVAIHQYADGQSDLAAFLDSKTAELGWHLSELPECSGGMGLGYTGSRVLHEQLGRYLAPGCHFATSIMIAALRSVSERDLIERIAGGEFRVLVPTAFDTQRVSCEAGSLSGQDMLMFGSSRPGLGAIPALESGSEPVLALVDLNTAV